VRVRAEHVIVTACRAHVDVNSSSTSLSDGEICSNCLRRYRALLAEENADLRIGAAGRMPDVAS
jgi:hypothetical protein